MKLSNAAVLRLLGLLSITFSITLVAIHIPVQIYGANETDFAFPLTTLMALPLPWVVLAVGLLSVPLWMANQALLRGVAAFWFSLSAAVWVSASFLILDVGVLDGETPVVVPESHAILAIVVLLAVASLGALAAYRAPRKALLAVAFLSVAQIGGSLFYIVQARPDGTPDAAVDPEALADLYRFSDQKNVLIVVLDGLQSTLFEDYLKQYPEIANDLEGFTFYRNTLGSAPTTYASMPPIHSGILFEPERSLKSAYEELVRSGSFVAKLARAGYRASLINPILSTCPEGVLCFHDQRIMNDNQTAVDYEYLSLLDISLLRAAPAWLKSWIFNGGSWRARRLGGVQQLQAVQNRNQRFLTRFIDSTRVSAGPPTVKFLHLLITHPPILTDDSCEPLSEQLKLTRENLALPASCALETVNLLLARLKELGVYDNSFVAVIADHGIRVRPVAKSNYVIGSAMPLLLVKRPAARGPMQISDMPAQIRDLAATVCKETGDCRSLGGTPLDELPESRRRSFFFYRWKHEFWTQDQIERVNEFEVDGLVWQTSSWTRIQPPSLPLDETVPINVRFPERTRYLDWGWSGLEDWGVWSDGPSAALSFTQTSTTQRPLDLVLDALLFIRPEVPDLSVSLTANGRPVGSWRFEHPQDQATIRARIEPEMWNGSTQMTITLDFARDIPLENLPTPIDRMLGVGMRSVRLESAATTND